MGNLKTKKQRAQEKIINFLQERFYVTDGELSSATLDPHWLRPQDVAQPLQQQCGVFLPQNREYQNWGEFIKVMVTAVCRQGIRI